MEVLKGVAWKKEAEEKTKEVEEMKKMYSKIGKIDVAVKGVNPNKCMSCEWLGNCSGCGPGGCEQYEMAVDKYRQF